MAFSGYAFSMPVVGGEFIVYRNDTVEKRLLQVVDGNPALRIGDEGDYTIRVLGQDGEVLWNEERYLYFGYSGPVKQGVDYSNITFDSVFVSAGIPYLDGMKTFQILHNETVIFSETLVLCNNNDVCEPDLGESSPTCSDDCPAAPTEPQKPAADYSIVAIASVFLSVALLYGYQKLKERALLREIGKARRR